jgi:hypothetical protein
MKTEATVEDKRRAIDEQLQAEMKHYQERGRPANAEKLRRELVELQEKNDRRGRK